MIRDILEDHIDESDYLFSQRLLSLQMADMSVDDIVELESRLRAHLDGLVLGGNSAWELCQDFLAEGSTSESFVAAIVAMECDGTPGLTWIEQALESESEEKIDGIRWACRLTVWPGIGAFLQRLLVHGNAQARAVALDVLTFRGGNPEKAIDTALQQGDRSLLIAGICAAGRCRMQQHSQLIEGHVVAADPDICLTALRSLVQIDPDKGRVRCLEIVRAETSLAPEAVTLLNGIGRQEDLHVLVKASKSSNHQIARSAILAIGEFGDISAVPFLIDTLNSQDLAGLAGVALKRMFGDKLPDDEEETTLDVIDADRVSQEDGGVEHGEAEQDDYEDLDDVGYEEEWVIDDDLVRLSPHAIKIWWGKDEDRFSSGVRYRLGQPT